MKERSLIRLGGNLFPLPKTANTALFSMNLSVGSNRTGDVCGQCKENFSVFFHSKLYSSKQYKSIDCTRCKADVHDKNCNE